MDDIKKLETNRWIFIEGPREKLEEIVPIKNGEDFAIKCPEYEDEKPTLCIVEGSKIVKEDCLQILTKMNAYEHICMVEPIYMEIYSDDDDLDPDLDLDEEGIEKIQNIFDLTARDFKSFMWNMYRVRL